MPEMKLEKQVCSLELSKKLKELERLGRDKLGRFIKGHKVIGGFKKGHIGFTPYLSEKHKQNIGLALKGRISPMKGRKMPLSAKKAISKALKGKPLLKIRGSRHYNWKNGRTKLQARIRHSVEYQNWRRKVFAKDNYTCVLCGSRNGNGKTIKLNADHYPLAFNELLTKYNIKTFKDAMICKALWKINLGRTLCVKCHKKTFKFWRNQYGTGETSC